MRCRPKDPMHRGLAAGPAQPARLQEGVGFFFVSLQRARASQAARSRCAGEVQSGRSSRRSPGPGRTTCRHEIWVWSCFGIVEGASAQPEGASFHSSLVPRECRAARPRAPSPPPTPLVTPLKTRQCGLPHGAAVAGGATGALEGSQRQGEWPAGGALSPGAGVGPLAGRRAAAGPRP